jgi:hypothetical protein
MLIPSERVAEVASRADEHERLLMWVPLVRRFAESFADLLDGVVQVRSAEPDRHARSSLGTWALKVLASEYSCGDWELELSRFRAAFEDDQFLTDRAAELELVLLAKSGRSFDPAEAMTSGVQLRILQYPSSRPVLEYFAKYGLAKRVRHVASLRLRRLPPGSGQETARNRA